MGIDYEDVFPFLRTVATVTAGMFAGGSVYINVVEHPARMAIEDTKSCHSQWMQSLDRAGVFQRRLALISAVSGVGAYFCNNSKGLPYLIGGGAVACIFPYTLFILKPKSIDPIYDEDITSKKSEEVVRGTIDSWNRYHMVRSLITVPVFIFLVAHSIYCVKK